ncbi:TonB-dependent receptor domain-containing protein [Arsenophonus endosymbiont of Crataerina pallida]
MHLAKSNRNYFKPFSRYKEESGCMHLAKSNRNYFKPFSRYKEESGCMHLAKSNRNYFKPFSRYKEESGCMHLTKSNRNYFKPFSRYKEDIHSLLAKGNWAITPSYMISAQLRYYQNDGIQLRNPEVVKPNYYTNSHYDRNTKQYDIQLTQKIYPLHTKNWLIDWDLYYSKLMIKQKPINKNNDENRSLNIQGSRITNYFTWDHNQFAAHQFNIGSEFYQQQQQSNKQANHFPVATLRNIAVWLEDEITLNKLPITFSAGTRYTNYKNDSNKHGNNQDSQWTSRAAISINPTNWLELFTSYAEGYRAPRLSEIYNDSRHFPGSYFKPNPNLRPERNHTIEYGLRLHLDNKLLANDSLQWRTTVFDTKATDYITTIIDGQRLDTLSINTPSVVIHGIDSRIIIPLLGSMLFSLTIELMRKTPHLV